MAKRRLPIGPKRWVTAAELSASTGLSARYFQKLAKRVPFATQPEPGGVILFDLDGYEAWMESGRPAQFRSTRRKPASKPRPPALADGEKPLVEALREMRLKLKAESKS